MPKTSVILVQNIVGLGGESDLVKVAAGYARNYLFPQGLAVPLTATNKRRIEALRQRRADREAHEFNTMSELSKSISKLIAVIAVKTGEDGKMFGTVTAGMIADQLKTQFDIVLDKRKIHLEHPIKALGEHDLELRLHADVKATLKLRVESTTPEVLPPVPAPQQAEERAGKEGNDGAARTESRGHKQRTERAQAETAAPETATQGHRPEKKPRAPKAEKAEKPSRSPKATKED
jgi:large subunit ribosomal protein L9